MAALGATRDGLDNNKSIRFVDAANAPGGRGKLACPGRIVHYAELSKLLIEHANHLARRIDRGEHITAAESARTPW